MTDPQNWLDEQALLDRARAFVAEVESAYADGGYAAGDGPSPPLDEVKWLLSEREKALRIISEWHQFANHLDRIADAAPNMRAADVLDTLKPSRERIGAASEYPNKETPADE